MTRTKTKAQWAKQIREVHDQIIRKTVEGFIGLGRMLIEAKDQLEYGDFTAMCERDLPFSARTAQRLMAIAEDQRLPTHVSVLPPSWGTLYELTRLSDETFTRAIAEGAIRPDMERADVERLLARKINIVHTVAPRQEPQRFEIITPPPTPPREVRMTITTPSPQVTTGGKSIEERIFRQSVGELVEQSMMALERIRRMQGPLTKQESAAIRNHGIAWLELAKRGDDDIVYQ
jgi:Protein of unknown function (DUF3102)